MSEIRRCQKCGKDSLKLQSSEWTGMETTCTFHCGHCGQEVKMEPIGGIGNYASVVFVLVIFMVIMAYFGFEIRSLEDWLITAAIAGLFIASVIVKLLPYWLNPLVAIDDEEDPSSAEATDPLIRAVQKSEQGSFLRNFGGFLLFVVLFLGGAALIGFVNFTYLHWW